MFVDLKLKGAYQGFLPLSAPNPNVVEWSVHDEEHEEHFSRLEPSCHPASNTRHSEYVLSDPMTKTSVRYLG